VKLKIGDLCTGHGRCYAIAPELFDCEDDTGYGVAENAGVVPSELEARAREAVSGCPEGAISLLET
jgi:ferredoxin